MSQWSREEVDSNDLNNGNEFDNNSNFSLTEINAIVNGSLYAQDTANSAKTTANNAKEIAENALEQAQSTGSKINVNDIFQQEVNFTSDPQSQISLLSSSLGTTNTNLQNETSARQSADTNLENAINGEISARQSADTNLLNKISDVEHVEEIYEHSSADPNINWGYTNGFRAEWESNGDVKISHSISNLNKYKKLRIYANFGGDYIIFDARQWSYVFRGAGAGFCWMLNSTQLQAVNCQISSNELIFRFRYLASNTLLAINNSQYVAVYRIEGVF